MANELGFNEEFNRSKLRYEFLRENYATLVELYEEKVHILGPNIANQYMAVIGAREYRIFELEVSLRRWRRRFALLQMALNRAEKPDFMEIEVILDRELKEYDAMVRSHYEQVHAATDFLKLPKLSEKETTDLRVAYLNAAKKLHPDLNPDQTDSAKELWLKIQAAYQSSKWEEFRFLVGLVEAVTKEELTFPAADTTNAIAEMEERCRALKRKCVELRAAINALDETEPFTYRAVLDDPGKLAEMSAEYDRRIAALEERECEYKKRWEEEVSDGK